MGYVVLELVVDIVLVISINGVLGGGGGQWLRAVVEMSGVVSRF